MIVKHTRRKEQDLQKALMVLVTVHDNTNVYIKMRSTARPTAEIETRVPMQYFMTSYLAASNWALKA